VDRGLHRHDRRPDCDLRSNIAAESRAKIIYERLINCTDDPASRKRSAS
jgi:Mn-containing catalase